jgi:hypothetical protein
MKPLRESGEYRKYSCSGFHPATRRITTPRIPGRKLSKINQDEGMSPVTESVWIVVYPNHKEIIKKMANGWLMDLREKVESLIALIPHSIG